MASPRALLTVVFLVFMLALAPGGLRSTAAQEARFGVSPSLLELDATPGADGEVTINVANTGGSPLEAVTGVAPIPSASAEHSAETWLRVEPASLSLEPGAEAALTVTIEVPEGLASGGYYAYVTVSAGRGSGNADNGNTAAIQGQIAVPFLITVNGDGEIERSVEIERFAPVLQPDGRIGFAALVRNSGNIHISLEGLVEVLLEDGSAYGSLDFARATPLLPGAERLLVTEASLPVQEGASYHATADVGGEGIDSASIGASFTMTPPELSIDALAICENLDRGPTVTFDIQNASTLGITGMVNIAVTAADGTPAGQGVVDQPPVLWPQGRITLATDIQQRLQSGEYTLMITLTPALGEPVEAERSFAIGGTGPLTAPICQAPATPTAER